MTEGTDALRCMSCTSGFPLIEGVPFLFESGKLPDFVRLEQSLQAEGVETRHSRGGEYHWGAFGIAGLLPEPAEFRRVLLLGCGDGGERPFLEGRGFQTVAFDIRRSPGTDFVADAHRLPLEDDCVDLVISMQVLEHVHSPWLVVDEIGRVLRPGGMFIGSVAFLKAFHDSYFHMTHLGVMHLLQHAGMETDYLAGEQSLTYSLYGSRIPVGTRKARRALYGSVDKLLAGTRAAVWALTRRLGPDARSDRFRVGFPMSFKEFDKLRYAPAVVFRARKRKASLQNNPHDDLSDRRGNSHFGTRVRPGIGRFARAEDG